MNRSSLYINKFEADLDVSFLWTLPNSLLREKRANMNYLCNALQLFNIFCYNQYERLRIGQPDHSPSLTCGLSKLQNPIVHVHVYLLFPS